jgi:putative tryptophan/tyrosine transport system substrate-binding protein
MVRPSAFAVLRLMGADASLWSPWTAAFVGRLRELGWIEDRTVAIEYRWAESRPQRYAEIAAEFVRLTQPHAHQHARAPRAAPDDLR